MVIAVLEVGPSSEEVVLAGQIQARGDLVVGRSRRDSPCSLSGLDQAGSSATLEARFGVSKRCRLGVDAMTKVRCRM